MVSLKLMLYKLLPHKTKYRDILGIFDIRFRCMYHLGNIGDTIVLLYQLIVYKNVRIPFRYMQDLLIDVIVCLSFKNRESSSIILLISVNYCIQALLL